MQFLLKHKWLVVVTLIGLYYWSFHHHSSYDECVVKKSQGLSSQAVYSVRQLCREEYRNRR